MVLRECYRYASGSNVMESLEMAAISCVADKQENKSLHMFDVQFFDEDNIIVVYGDDASGKGFENRLFFWG